MVDILYDNGIIAPDSLAALDATSVTLARLDGARSQGFRVSRIEAWVSWQNNNSTEAAVAVGLAVGASAAEIETALEADPQGNNSISDKVAQEQANTPAWPIGVISGTVGQPAIERVLKPNWSVPEGVGMFFWVYNISTLTALHADSGAIIWFLKAFGVWLRD